MTTTAREMTAISALDVRGDFPILAREFEGKPLVYLDSGATSQKPRAVIEAMDAYYEQHNANVHRGVYALAQESDAAYDGRARRSRGSWAGSRRRRSSPRT